MLEDALDALLFIGDFSRRAKASLMLELMAITAVVVGLVIRNDGTGTSALSSIGLFCWAAVAVGYSIWLWWAGVTTPRKARGAAVFGVGVVLTVVAVFMAGPEATAGFEFSFDWLWAYASANVLFGFLGGLWLAMAPVEDTG